MMKNRIGHRAKYASAGGLEIVVEGDHRIASESNPPRRRPKTIQYFSTFPIDLVQKLEH